MQKRGWPYLIGGFVGILLLIGGTMLLDTVTVNPYQGLQNDSENPGNGNTANIHYAEDVTTITIQIAPTLENCTGVGPQKCMLVREMPATEDGDWELFYDRIEGFTYEEGYVWTLRVNVTGVENPPADASGLRYELVEVVEKKPVA